MTLVGVVRTELGDVDCLMEEEELSEGVEGVLREVVLIEEVEEVEAENVEDVAAVKGGWR